MPYEEEKTDKLSVYPGSPLSRPSARIPCLVVLTGQSAGRIYRMGSQGLLVGRNPDVDIVLQDPGVSRRHAHISSRPDGTVWVTDLSSTNGTHVAGEAIQCRQLAENEEIGFGAYAVLKFCYQDNSVVTLHKQLYESATHDSTTGALNRKHFTERLAGEITHARRHQIPLAVLMMDIDYFKKVNDTYGHAAGDEVLRELVRRVATLIRTGDAIGRYGGEEFMLLVRNTDLQGGLVMGERIRAEVERRPFAVPTLKGEQLIPVTLSVGVAAYDRSAQEESLLPSADAALYRAKQDGRNRVAAAT